jgi:hypothetical protein
MTMTMADFYGDDSPQAMHAKHPSLFTEAAHEADRRQWEILKGAYPAVFASDRPEDDLDAETRALLAFYRSNGGTGAPSLEATPTLGKVVTFGAVATAPTRGDDSLEALLALYPSYNGTPAPKPSRDLGAVSDSGDVVAFGTSTELDDETLALLSHYPSWNEGRGRKPA